MEIIVCVKQVPGSSNVEVDPVTGVLKRDGVQSKMNPYDLDDEKWEETLCVCFDCLYKKAEQMGGLVSGEHGIGFAKKEYLKRQYGSEQIELMKGIKRVFDPKNILNPNKICF